MAETHTVGRLLATVRRQQGRSQLQVACDAGVTAKHISFIETGRTLPTRQMILRLASAMCLTSELRDRLLLAAGLVPLMPMNDGCSIRCPRATERTLEQALSINAAGSAEDAMRCAADVLSAFGLVHFFAGVLTPNKAANTPLVIHIREGGRPPVGWLAHYEKYRYRDIDPLVNATAKSSHAFFWHEIIRRPLPQRAKRMLGEAAEFRIDEGFVVPIRWADSRVHAVSTMGHKVETRDPTLRFKVRLLCTALLERLEAPDEAPFIGDATPQLAISTARYLRSLAYGMSVQAISDKYHRPIREVRATIADACVALGVTNEHQAVLRARRYGLIQL